MFRNSWRTAKLNGWWVLGLLEWRHKVMFLGQEAQQCKKVQTILFLLVSADFRWLRPLKQWSKNRQRKCAEKKSDLPLVETCPAFGLEEVLYILQQAWWQGWWPRPFLANQIPLDVTVSFHLVAALLNCVRVQWFESMIGTRYPFGNNMAAHFRR